MSQLTTSFTEVVQLITAARQRAIQAVNTTLIELYWQIGEIISRKIAAAEWGDGVVEQLQLTAFMSFTANLGASTIL
jgi:DUF1016 N-terminal domain